MSFLHINYDEECAKIGRFIETFHDDQKKPKYVDYMKRVSKGKQDSILIELDDIKKFFPDDSIVESIEKNTRRYHTLFCRIIDPLIPESRNVINDESSPVEVMIAVRKQLDLDRENSGQTNDADNQQFPPELTRK
ncbi:Mcm2-7 hexameric complex component [Lobulomyces angularis]|nr:Mcm2-7 hexameric complex component [Lobulomyces angularis]